jgi:predicted RNA polymerase sigma factor
MSGETLDFAASEAGGRIIAALAARFRDLDIAEDAFADACAKAAAERLWLSRRREAWRSLSDALLQTRWRRGVPRRR